MPFPKKSLNHESFDTIYQIQRECMQHILLFIHLVNEFVKKKFLCRLTIHYNVNERDGLDKLKRSTCRSALYCAMNTADNCVVMDYLVVLAHIKGKFTNPISSFFEFSDLIPPPY